MYFRNPDRQVSDPLSYNIFIFLIIFITMINMRNEKQNSGELIYLNTRIHRSTYVAFKRAVIKKYGSTKGFVRKAVEEALKEWTEKVEGGEK